MAYASVGWRAVAAIIDAGVLFAVAYAVAVFTGGITETGFELQGGPAFLSFLIWFVYYAAMEATLGASLGKFLLGLRVVKEDGAPIGWPAAIVRNVLRVVDGFLFYLVAALLVWGSHKRQRLGDRVAGTVVIRQRNAAAEVAP
ncbi:MAG: RDD family protein [Trueperaceae bacterium]